MTLLPGPNWSGTTTAICRNDPAALTGKHVVWLIENAPYAEELGPSGPNRIDPGISEAYIAGRNAWRSHVEREPENPVFIARYARFVGWKDRSLHIELLARASRLDSQNADLARELGHTLLLASKRTEENDRAVQAAEQALEHFDRAYRLADSDITRNSILGGRAQAAFAAGRYDLAKQHAQAMLDAKPFRGPDGDLLHEGNTMLGRVALVDGDVERAKSHLLASGNVPTSPVLGSFGPSMSLASELLRPRPAGGRARLFRSVCGFLGPGGAAGMASRDQRRHGTALRVPRLTLSRRGIRLVEVTGHQAVRLTDIGDRNQLRGRLTANVHHLGATIRESTPWRGRSPATGSRP